MIAPTGLVRIAPPLPPHVSATFVPIHTDSTRTRVTAATGALITATPLPLAQSSQRQTSTVLTGSMITQMQNTKVVPGTQPANLASSSTSSTLSTKSPHDIHYQLELGFGISMRDPAMTIKSLKTTAGVRLLEKSTGLGFADAVSLRITCLKRLKRAADNGDVGAMRELMKVYEEVGDTEMCIAYLMQAALGGDAESLMNLGVKYEQGFGSLVKNLDNARICYARMLENVYVSPQYELRSIVQKRLYVLSAQRPA